MRAIREIAFFTEACHQKVTLYFGINIAEFNKTLFSQLGRIKREQNGVKTSRSQRCRSRSDHVGEIVFYVG